MTPAEAIELLNRLDDDDYPEHAHQDADKCLCEVLSYLGYEELATAFEEAAGRVPFWYA